MDDPKIYGIYIGKFQKPKLAIYTVYHYCNVMSIPIVQFDPLNQEIHCVYLILVLAVFISILLIFVLAG